MCKQYNILTSLTQENKSTLKISFEEFCTCTTTNDFSRCCPLISDDGFVPTYLQEEMVRSLNYKEAGLGFSIVEKCPYLKETE